MVDACTIMVDTQFFERVKAAIEREFPQGVVTRFPDSMQSDERVDEWFLTAKWEDYNG